jgi:hypothetical protein
MTDTSKVNRIEIITDQGRIFVGYGFSDVTLLSLQDDGRTLKLFCKQSLPVSDPPAK